MSAYNYEDVVESRQTAWISTTFLCHCSWVLCRRSNHDSSDLAIGTREIALQEMSLTSDSGRASTPTRPGLRCKNVGCRRSFRTSRCIPGTFWQHGAMQRWFQRNNVADAVPHLGRLTTQTMWDFVATGVRRQSLRRFGGRRYPGSQLHALDRPRATRL